MNNGNLTLLLLTILSLIDVTQAKAQVFVDIQTAEIIRPCEEALPVTLTLANETDYIIRNSTLNIGMELGMEYVAGSIVSTNVHEINVTQPDNVLLQIEELLPCERFSFTFYVRQGCSEYSGDRTLSVRFNSGAEKASVQKNIFSISPDIDLVDVTLDYDRKQNVFRRRIQIVNIGGTASDQLGIQFERDKQITVLASTPGQFNPSESLVNLTGDDFARFGNHDYFFDAGEVITLEQTVRIDSCIDDYIAKMSFLIPCETDTCVIERTSHYSQGVTIGKPRFAVWGMYNENNVICDTIIDTFKLFVNSDTFRFELNHAYNLSLALGWNMNEIIDQSNINDYRRDDCFPIYEIVVGKARLKVGVGSGKGWKIDFSGLTSDPDGPGGLSDLDRDGVYDDLADTDTLKFAMKYIIRQSCFTQECLDGTRHKWVFPPHKLALELFYANYCKERTSSLLYYSNYTDFGASVRARARESSFVDNQTDTLEINAGNTILGLTLYGNQLCNGHDSLVVKLKKGAFYSIDTTKLPEDESGKISYTESGEYYFFSFDSSAAKFKVPVVFHCDPNNKPPVGTPVRTPCTPSCSGAKNTPYYLETSMEYYCDTDCPYVTRTKCSSLSKIYVYCEGDRPKPANGSLKLGGLDMRRLSFGYTDSTRTTRANPATDSLALTTILPLDTVRMAIPVSVTCDANFSKVILKIQQGAFKVDLSKLAFQYLTDTFLYFKKGQMTPRVLTGLITPHKYDNANPNLPTMQLDLSGIVTDKLGETLGAGDSMVYILYAATTKHISYKNDLFGIPLNYSIIRAKLLYMQDSCFFEDMKAGGFYTIVDKLAKPPTYLSYVHKDGFRAFVHSPGIPNCAKLFAPLYLEGDNYISLDRIDPFPNEFRRYSKIEEMKVVIPKALYPVMSSTHIIFQRVVPDPKVWYRGDFFYDTIPITNFAIQETPTTVEVSLFDLFANMDISKIFKLVIFRFKDDCLKHYKGDIRYYWRVRYHIDKPLKLQETKEYNGTITFQKEGLERAFSRRHQILYKDSIVRWPFKLSHSVDLAGKSKGLYKELFLLNKIWVYAKSSSNLIEPLYIVDSRDLSHPVKIPFVPSGSEWRALIDTLTLIDNGRFNLVAKVRSCFADSIQVRMGASCDAPPLQFDRLSDYCQQNAYRDWLIVNPKFPKVFLNLQRFPDSLGQDLCEPLEYHIRVKNQGVGNAYHLWLYADVPAGVIPAGAIVRLPGTGAATINLGAPSPGSQGGTYYWTIPSNTFVNGLSGVLGNQTELDAEVSFDVDCAVENESQIRFYCAFSAPCGKRDTSHSLITPPLLFTTGELDKEDYGLQWYMDDIDSCGDVYTFHIRLEYNGASPSTANKYQFVFDRNLRYIPKSFTPLHNVMSAAPEHKLREETESLVFELTPGTQPGDSVVLEFQIQNTCYSNCTRTDFDHFILTPKQIRCPDMPVCTRDVPTQRWNEKDVAMFPELLFEKGGHVDIIGSSGKSVKVRFEFGVKNISRVIHRKVTVDFYYDADNDGHVGSGESIVFSGTWMTGDLYSDGKFIITDTRDIPADSSCPLIMVIDPAHNECLCYPDTLKLHLTEEGGQERYFSTCDPAKSLEVGYPNANPALKFQWASNPFLSETNSANPVYQYTSPVPPGMHVYDTLYVSYGYSALCTVTDTVYIDIGRLDVDLVQYDELLCAGDTNAVIGLQEASSKGMKLYWPDIDDTTDVRIVPAGTYRAVIVDSFGCRVERFITVNAPPGLEDSIRLVYNYNGYAISCNGGDDAEIRVIAKGGKPGYRFSWSDGAQDSVRRMLSAGTYEVTVTDQNGCTEVARIRLDEPDPVEVHVSKEDALCSGEKPGSASASAVGGIPGYTFAWSTGDSGPMIDNLTSGRYTLTVTDANACSKEVTVQIDDVSPNYHLMVDQTGITIYRGEQVRLGFQFDGPIKEVTWSPDEGLDCIKCSNPVAKPTHDIQYKVEVIDENGCVYTDFVSVVVKYKDDVYVPNVFTPNGDHLNDVFKPYFSTSFDGVYEMRIYDRWGELVFVKEEVDPFDERQGWNGSFHGTHVNPGVFVYVILTKPLEGEGKVLRGSVTLIK